MTLPAIALMSACCCEGHPDAEDKEHAMSQLVDTVL